MSRVEARYLNGDSVFLENCSTVGAVMVRIAMMHDCFATDVVVILLSGDILEDVSAPAPSEVSVTLRPAIDERDEGWGRAVRQNLLLHGEYEDVETCRRLLEMDARGDGDHVDLDAVLDAGKDQERGLVTVVSTLLDLGVPVGNALSRVARRGGSQAVTMIELLLSYKANVNYTARHGASPLEGAVRKGDCAVVSALLAARASVNLDDKEVLAGRESVQSQRTSPLISAVSLQRFGVVELLLEARASVNFADRSGATALSYAASLGHYDVVDALISAEADVNVMDLAGISPLAHSAANGHLRVVKRLLTVCDADEKALRLAVRGGHGEVVDVLRSALASCTQVNRKQDPVASLWRYAFMFGEVVLYHGAILLLSMGV